MNKEIEKAKKYLSEKGYGTGSNLTISVVASLMVDYAKTQEKAKKGAMVKMGTYCSADGSAKSLFICQRTMCIDCEYFINKKLQDKVKKYKKDA